ncbi:hypothetical protein [Streptomyces sp. NPDC053755]|uniref:hypothetical protein n=1 Tax=Streptomyces sp. NPDC053755 TaxID=3155815 RepID=UPI003439193E
MGKKQTRVNHGARTGGHEQKTTVAAKEQPGASAARESSRPLVERVSHRKERKFGHN